MIKVVNTATGHIVAVYMLPEHVVFAEDVAARLNYNTTPESGAFYYVVDTFKEDMLANS